MKIEPARLVCTSCGDPLRPGRFVRCDDCVGRGRLSLGVWVVVFAWLVIAIAIVVIVNLVAAPRSGSAYSPAPALTEASRHDSPGGSARQARGAPPGEETPTTIGMRPASNGAAAAASPPAATPAPALHEPVGWATWFDDGAGYYGAVHSWRFRDDPYAVQVCLADRPGTCTHVVVRDFCACGDRHGDPTVIDLSPSAFAELAPLSRGVVRVIVSGRIDIPLPPTDGE